MKPGETKPVPATYYNYKDIMALCGVGRNRAYEIIHQLNDELVKKGKLVPKGTQVSRKYAEARLAI